MRAVVAAVVAVILVTWAAYSDAQPGTGVPDMGHVRPIKITGLRAPLACWRTSEPEGAAWRTQCVPAGAIQLDYIDGEFRLRQPLDPIECTETEHKLDCTQGNSPTNSPITVPGTGPYRPA